MESTPKHSRWQIHLSTAIVVMLIAGGVLGINHIRHSGIEINNGNIVGAEFAGYGYPFVYAYANPPESFEEPIRIGSLILDIIFAIAICFVCAVLREWLIRRREDRKQ